MPRRRSRRAALRVALGAAALGLAAACAAIPSPVTVSTPRPTPHPRQAGAKPRAGGTAVYALAAEPDTLDPANALTGPAEAVGRLLFDTLVQLGPDGEPRPGLAERWDISPDGLSYTFVLRRDVSFHDGTRLDAAAARYSLQRLLGDERPRARGLLVGLVRTVEASGDRRLVVTLGRPFSPTLHLFAQFGTALVSPVAPRGAPADFGRSPVGSGPFRFAGRAPNGELRLDRWDEGWRGPPLLERVVFRPTPDEAARLALLERGEAHLVGPVALERLPDLQGTDGLAVDFFPTARVLGVALNTQVAPFTDKRIRQALNAGLDKDALARGVYAGQATPLGGPVAPSVRGAAALLPYAFDPGRARKLLTDAGFPSLLEFPLVGARGRVAGDASLASAIQQQLQASGVRVRLELLDPTEYSATVTKAADETPLRLTVVDWLPRTLDLRAALYPLFHSSQWMPRGQNASFYKNPVFDGLLERATEAADPAEADRLFRRAQDLLRDEAPWIFLLSPKTPAARSADLHEPLLLPTELVTLSERTWVEE